MSFYQCTEIIDSVDFDWGWSADALLVNTYIGNHIGSIEIYFDSNRKTRLFRRSDVGGMKDLFFELQEAIADVLQNPSLDDRERYENGVPAEVIPYERWGCKYETKPSHRGYH